MSMLKNLAIFNNFYRSGRDSRACGSRMTLLEDGSRMTLLEDGSRMTLLEDGSRMTLSESGRSMIEMLGVLAVVGVLSVGSISGYSKAMTKYKVNKTAEQVLQLVTNIRTLYSKQHHYDFDDENIDKKKVFTKNNVIPDGMRSDYTSTDLKLEHPFGGVVNVSASNRSGSDDKKAFTVELKTIPEDACMDLLTYDWGGGSGSGLIAIGNTAVTDTSEGCNSSEGKYACSANVPMSPVFASKICKSVSNDIVIKFY